MIHDIGIKRIIVQELETKSQRSRMCHETCTFVEPRIVRDSSLKNDNIMLLHTLKLFQFFYHGSLLYIYMNQKGHLCLYIRSG